MIGTHRDNNGDRIKLRQEQGGNAKVIAESALQPGQSGSQTIDMQTQGIDVGVKVFHFLPRRQATALLVQILFDILDQAVATLAEGVAQPTAKFASTVGWHITD